jgi:hypothetical protein
VEFNDLQIGNWFYVQFAHVLGLDYHYVKASSFSHDDASVPLIVAVEDVIASLERAIPQLQRNQSRSSGDGYDSGQHLRLIRYARCVEALAVLHDYSD